jgi:hypothetical protein
LHAEGARLGQYWDARGEKGNTSYLLEHTPILCEPCGGLENPSPNAVKMCRQPAEAKEDWASPIDRNAIEGVSKIEHSELKKKHKSR